MSATAISEERRSAMAGDEELVKRVISGDCDALDELLERYYPKILKYCLWHLPSREEAEDVTQEVMIKVIRHMRRKPLFFQFRPYIYQIAKNTCTDMYRKKKIIAVSLDDEENAIDLPAPEPTGGIWDEELVRAIRSLPEDLREVILLRYCQELSLREVAAAADVPLRTAQSRLHRAIEKLRKEYRHDL